MANIYGTNTNNTLYGTNLGDSIYGYAGNDTLYGGGGHDRIEGGLGADAMHGGYGSDTYVVDHANDTISEGAAAKYGYDTVESSISYTLGTGLEALTLLGTGNTSGYGNNVANLIKGNSGHNTLYGYAGQDTIYGYGGNDYIDGGVDADTMYGGRGNDTYIVDNAGDQAIEAAAQGYDTVKSYVSYTLGSGLEELVLLGNSDIDGAGNDDANVIKGNTGNNDLYGYGGDDTIYGYGGNDYLSGWTGDDDLYGGNGDDTVSGSDGLDYVNGGNGNDYLYGGTGSDELLGGAGDDTLAGYGYSTDEYDIMTGGLGADTFVIGDAWSAYYQDANPGFEYGYATIEDFNYAEGDKIQVFGSYTDYTVTDIGDDAYIYHNSNTDDLVAIVVGGAGASLVPSADFVSA